MKTRTHAVAAAVLISLLPACWPGNAPASPAASATRPPRNPAQNTMAADAPRQEPDRWVGPVAAAFRDPFRSVDALDDQEPLPPSEGALLSSFSLEQLSLVATVVGLAVPVAMVQEPGGQGHLLREGTILSRGGLRVRSIGRDQVVLESRVRGHDGRWESTLLVWRAAS